MTFDDVFKKHNNSGPGFHFLRHFLAFAIIVVHCRAAVYFSTSPGLIAADIGGSVSASSYAGSFDSLTDIVRPAVASLVGAFFGLSGFLVTGSALRLGKVKPFIAARALRIFPALTVEVTLSAIFLGFMFSTLAPGDYFTDPGFFRYFGNIFGFVSYYLPGVFEDNRWPGVVNGNLWTLAPEFWCYIVMGLCIAVGVMKRRFLFVSLVGGFIISCFIVSLIDPALLEPRSLNAYHKWYVVLMFFVGVVFYLVKDKLPYSWILFAICGAAFWASIFFDVLVVFSGIPLMYCTTFIGLTDFKAWNENVKIDLSYGMYLYGFPIMQMFSSIMDHSLPLFQSPTIPMIAKFVILTAATLFATMFFSWYSWILIEEPALKLKKKFA